MPRWNTFRRMEHPRRGREVRHFRRVILRHLNCLPTRAGARCDERQASRWNKFHRVSSRAGAGCDLWPTVTCDQVTSVSSRARAQRVQNSAHFRLPQSLPTRAGARCNNATGGGCLPPVSLLTRAGATFQQLRQLAEFRSSAFILLLWKFDRPPSLRIFAVSRISFPAGTMLTPQPPGAMVARGKGGRAMDELCTEAERRLQGLKDKGLRFRVTWFAGGYGDAADNGGLRVLIEEDQADYEQAIREKLDGIGVPVTVARLSRAKPTSPF